MKVLFLRGGGGARTSLSYSLNVEKFTKNKGFENAINILGFAETIHM